MTRTTTTSLLAGVLALGLVIGCGGADEGESAPGPTAPAAADATSGADADTDTGGSGVGTGDTGGGEIADELLDEMDEQGQTVGDAIDSLPDETIWGIVADQLGAGNDVEIDGSNIRLRLDDGTIDDGDFDCLVASSFLEEGQTVTMSYPDGDVSC